MDAGIAARRWADTWSRAWPQRDGEAIVELYADTAVQHSTPFRQPGLGPAGGQELTYAGVSVLRFGGHGQVIEHRDYAHHIEQRQPTYADW